MLKDLLKSVRLIVMFYAVASLVITPYNVSAAELPFDYASNNILYYEPCGVGTSDGNSKTIGKVYILGDSITHGARDEYEKKFKEAGATEVKVNASVGRNFNGPGTAGDVGPGYEAIDKDKDFIKGADTIIIAIGTNQMESNINPAASDSDYVTSSQKSIKQALDKIKATETKANISWVDVAISSKGPAPYPRIVHKINKAIYASQADGYSVISWSKVVDSGYKPEDASGPVNDTAGLLSDGIHPSAKGAEKLVETVVKGATSGSAQGSSSNSGSTSDVNSTVTSQSNDLTIEQKIAKTFIVGFEVAGGPEEPLKLIDKYKLGGLFMTGNGAGNTFNKGFFDNARQKSLGTFISTADQEGGSVDRYSLNTPSAQEMGNMPNDKVTEAGKNTANKLKENGILVNLAPILDLDSPTNGTNHLAGGKRAFSNDPGVVSDKAGTYAKSLSDSQIVPTYKHFPGIGAVAGNTDEVAASMTYDINDPNVQPFKSLAKENGGVVMLSNAYITNLGNMPAPVNKSLIDSLKSEVGYGGPVMTDDLGALAKYYQPLDSVIVDSFKSGVDLPLFKNPGDTQLKNIIDRVKRDVPTDRIEDAYKKAIDLADRANFDSEGNGNACCPGQGGGSSMAGENNASKMFNFLTGKGLSPEQAAGAVGNMILESGGVEPQRKEGVFDRPVPSSEVQGWTNGWGIVQWTPAAGKILKEKEPDKLSTQAEYLWKELEGGEKAALADLKTKTTAEDAAKSFAEKYERPAAWALAESLSKRQTYAKAILESSKGKPLPPEIEQTISKNDGGGSPTGGSSSGSSSAGCETASSGEYKDPFRDITQSEDVVKRIDGGVDQGNSSDVDKSIYPLGPAKVTGVWATSAESGWPGVPGSYIKYELTSGPLKGKSLYITEDCTPKVKEGDTLDANRPICTYTYKDSWMEIGFAEPGKETGSGYVKWSDYNSGGGNSYASNSGMYIHKWLKKVGGKGGSIQGPESTAQPPADWPKV